MRMADGSTSDERVPDREPSLRVTSEDLSASVLRVKRQEVAGDDSPGSTVILGASLAAITLIVVALVGAVRAVSWLESPGGSNVVTSPEEAPLGVQGGIRTLERLAAGVATLHVRWGDRGGQGSAGVWDRLEDGRLVLVTNRHCTLLEESGGGTYEMHVAFVDGSQRRVVRIGLPNRDVDLCLLELDRPLPTAVILPRTDIPWDELGPGVPVVAVGSPLGLDGTYTFGRVSAIREGTVLSRGGKWIQIDAAIWPGSSGGPVFAEHSSGWAWTGIATAVGPRDVRFAVHVESVMETDFRWYDADTAGAAAAARDVRSVRSGRASS